MERIRAYWDNNGDTAGWYAERVREDGSTIDDSQKAWWLVDMDAFGREESEKLDAALREAYPGVEVEVRA